MNTHSQKIAVMGAGAVGCYFGGLLAKAGHDVVLIAREAHVEAIGRDGLRLETAALDEHIRLTASTEPQAVAGADLVLFCVKSTDTESAAAAIRPYLAPHALVLTLQNGVDNDIRLAALIPQETAATVVYVATAMAGPGHVRHFGRGDLVMAPSSRGEAVAALLVAAGIPTEISANVRGALWAKLIVNCAYNALSAITAMPYGELLEQAGMPDIILSLVAECLSVARAEGIEVPDQLSASVLALASTMPGQLSSTAQDMARGRRSEIDHLNGVIVRSGARHGIATPSNALVLALVKAMESRH